MMPGPSGSRSTKTPRIQQMTQEGQALCNLARAGDMDGLLAAIDGQGYPVDARGLNEQTALILASQQGRVDMMQELLNRGANPAAVDFDGKGCLSYALSAKSQCGEALRVLLDAGANMNAQDQRHRTVIDKAQQLNNGDAIAVFSHYGVMPLVGTEDVTKEKLFQRNHARLTPLHTPRTWHYWPRISDALAARGERITKEEWLAPDGVGEVSLLERAVQCRAFDAALADMQRHGDTLTLEDMLPDGKPAPWVNALGENRQLGKLMQASLWQGSTPQDLVQLRMAIPDEQRGQLKNYFQLKAVLDQRHMGVGR